MRSILAYGDSNTYGYDPGRPGEMRYPKNVRWTGILDQSPAFSVKNAGMNGVGIPAYPASTAAFFASEIRAGRADWILFWLGTNDLLTASRPSAEKVALKMEGFLKEVQNQDAGILFRLILLSPPRLLEGLWTNQELVEESRHFSPLYRELALKYNLSFLDAASWDLPTTADGVHFTAEGHRIVAEKIQAYLLARMEREK